MLLKHLVLGVRVNVGDTLRAKFSDYEIITTINEALSIINTSLTEMGSHIVSKEIDITEDPFELPEDFNHIISLTNSKDEQVAYKIIGNTVYAPGATKMIYSCAFPFYEELDDNIPIPNIYMDLIKLAAAGFLNKTNEIEFRNLLRQEIQRISAGREIHTYELSIPFNL